MIGLHYFSDSPAAGVRPYGWFDPDVLIKAGFEVWTLNQVQNHAGSLPMAEVQISRSDILNTESGFKHCLKPEVDLCQYYKKNISGLSAAHELENNGRATKDTKEDDCPALWKKGMDFLCSDANHL